ncbi:head-tail connector protein [Vulgatibacter sp.]|uniref:head-tail connector protein n=1 Tax=Vulgatibacter sp. TaxID=1971226 RepID=UPI0035674920
MALQVVNAGASPVTLQEAKDYLRVDGADEDSTIQRLIDSAVEYSQEYTGRQLCTATLRLVLDAFPCGRELELPRAPLRSVTSVQYYDEAGQLQTLEAAAYHEDTVTMPGRLVLAAGQSWPATQCRPGAVRIDFEAGHGEAAAVPARIRSAILVELENGYRERGDRDNRGTVTDLLRPFKVW